jgi:hypothetical protein
MSHTWDDLHGMTVAQLREIAAGIEHPAVHGYSTMHKEHLLPAICEALDIEAHAHHEVIGLDKKAVKSKIRELKAERDAAIETKDPRAVKRARRRIHRLKRKIRRSTV